ncbi:MAG: diguanylate cyclase, partial [Bacillota bacterium]
DSSGKIIVSNKPSEEGLMLDKTKLYQSIMSGADSYNGLLRSADDTLKMEVAVPVLDENGKIIGILRQIVKPDDLILYLDNLNNEMTDYAFLIRKNGSMIVNSSDNNLALFYHEYRNENTLEQLASDFKNDRLKKDRGAVEFQVKGTEYIGAYKKIDRIDCIAIAAINRNEMISEMIHVKKMIFILGFFIALLSGGIGFYLGNAIAKPVREFNEKLRKIADGDLTVRCKYVRNDEFKELSNNINKIAENLQKSERELRMTARIDNLTHLPNRYAIYEVLDTLLNKHPNQALLLLDLDGFGQINDDLGHEIGDRILMEVGDILRSLPQHICYSSRVGGDEFMVFITNWTADRYPEKVAEKIIRKIQGIRFIDEIHVDISVSIGIEYIDGEKLDKKKRIKHSDFAMHKAKNTGKNSYLVYYPYLQKEN